MVTNGFTYTIDGKEYGSAAYSAVHYTDFVGRSPLIAFRSKYIVGGNEPTGGVENRRFLYSHSSYFKLIPKDKLTDNDGNYIDRDGNRVNEPVDNPYLDDFKEKWGDVGRLNPSLPVWVKPKNSQKEVNYNENSH